MLKRNSKFPVVFNGKLIKEAFLSAWACYKSYWVRLAVCLIVYLISGLVIRISFDIVFDLLPEEARWLLMLRVLLELIVGSYLLGGLLHAVGPVLSGDRPHIFGMLRGYKYVLHLTIATVLLGMAMVLLGVPFLLLIKFVQNSVLSTIAILVLFVLEVWLYLRCSCFYLRVVLANDNGLDALIRSFELTRGNAGILLISFLIVACMILAGLAFAVVGILVTAPFALVFYMRLYLMLEEV